MSRETHVRFWESAGVQSPRATHLPLARQVRQMARLGLTTDTQTLWDQLHALYRHLQPTAEALHALVLASPVIAADETRWPHSWAPGRLRRSFLHSQEPLVTARMQSAGGT